ncbi:MAG TPA: PEP-CTERM sorting domain-containing protein [Phycisphaerae bacterium]|jgi:hypothetical protein
MSLTLQNCCAMLVICLFTGSPARAIVSSYDFTIHRDNSGLNASVSLTAGTSGTLIGNFDAVNNPTGTRTKPGLFGPFGDLENVPVPVSVGTSLSGNAQSSTAGGFHLDLDVTNGLLGMSGYSADFLNSGPLVLPASVTFEFDTFRTRSPTSLYIGGFPLTLPLGDATLDTLSAAQSDLPALGVLTQTGPNEFDFLIAPLVTLTGTLSLLGTQFDLPPTPVPLPLQGHIVVAGTSALLTSMQPIQFANMTDPGLMLPEIPFDLPTILPPGEIAHLLLNLTLDDLAANIDGTLNLEANGVLVPEPGSFGLLLIALAAGLRRRAS